MHKTSTPSQGHSSDVYSSKIRSEIVASVDVDDCTGIYLSILQKILDVADKYPMLLSNVTRSLCSYIIKRVKIELVVIVTPSQAFGTPQWIMPSLLVSLISWVVFVKFVVAKFRFIVISWHESVSMHTMFIDLNLAKSIRIDLHDSVPLQMISTSVFTDDTVVVTVDRKHEISPSHDINICLEAI